MADAAERPTGKAEKSDSSTRWLVLFLACCAMIGNYYCFDNPAALKTSLEEFVGLTESEFNWLYTIYSLPNIILPFFGGYLCDKLGARRCFVLFAAAIGVGQVIFAFGTSVKSIPIMMIGRVVFGLGGENMAVGSSVIMEDWFRGKEMALAMGLNLAISRIGSVVNNVVSPAVANSTNVPFSLFFGAFICGGSLLCTMVIYPLDMAAEQRVKKENAKLNGGESLNASLLEDEAEAGFVNGSAPVEGAASTEVAKSAVSGTTDHGRESEGEAARTRSVSYVADPDAVVEGAQASQGGCADVAKFGKAFWLLTFCCVVVYGDVIPFNNVASSLLMERNYFKPQYHDKCALDNIKQCQSKANEPNAHCESGDVWKPPLPYNISEDDIVCTDNKWKKGCTKEYCDREIAAEASAAFIMSIPYFMSACLSPLLGGTVDKVGGRAIVCLLSASILVLVHYILGFMPDVNPAVPMVGQGLAYSMFASALWPSVPYTVDENSVGLAYGVITAVQNAGLAGLPLIVSAVYNDSDNLYIPYVEVLFIAFGAVGVLSALGLNILAPELNLKHPPKIGASSNNEGINDSDVTAKYDILNDN